LLEVRVSPATENELPGPFRIVLTDGTRVHCTSLSAADSKFQFKTPYGSGSVPLSAVVSVRLGKIDEGVSEAWDDHRTREIRRDMLVVRKDNDVLDHLDGIIGDITEEGEDGQDGVVNFLVAGNQVPLNRKRVFGLVFSRRTKLTTKPACRILLSGGDVVPLKSVAFSDGQLKGQSLSGVELTFAAEAVRSLDFSLGRLLYLSRLEPREVKYTPFFDIEWKYRRDRNLDGGPLRVGNKVYSRGLAIHSKTYLRYRIGSEYRRFKAVMGIDQVVGRKGDVHVVISGDGKVLFEGEVRGTDEPHDLDLPVEGVRDLEILVDFGADLDIADHLDLADARVLK
jgi:hypothetical protein